MKLLEHPNLINLVEVIDDPESDRFYMGNFVIHFPFFLKYSWVCPWPYSFGYVRETACFT